MLKIIELGSTTAKLPLSYFFYCWVRGYCITVYIASNPAEVLHRTAQQRYGLTVSSHLVT